MNELLMFLMPPVAWVLLYFLGVIATGMWRLLKKPVEAKSRKAPVPEPPVPQEPLIIGLSGKSGCGKSATASALQKLLPGIVVRMSFADTLKEEVSRIFKFPLEWCYTNKNGYLLCTFERYAAGMPHALTVRKLLQWYGTDVMRSRDPEYWVDAMRRKLKETNAHYVIIDDVRFPNEARMVGECGGILVRLNHFKQLMFLSNHESETALDDYSSWNMVFHPLRSKHGVDINVVRAILVYLGVRK